MHCADCGTKYSNGLCPNCHEEAFILETQGDFIDHVSPEFKAKAIKQEAAAAQARRLAKVGGA